MALSLTSDAIEQARQRWPGVALPAECMHQAWARLTDTVDGPLPAYLDGLFLAVACLERDAAALEHLSRLIQSLLPRFRSFALGEAELSGLAQDTFADLVGTGLLRRYAGRGALEGWLMTVMSRRALRLHRASAQVLELDDVLLGDLTSESAPELELLKRRFRGVFSQAFRTAITRLTTRHRNLLRQHYLDQLSLDDLGLMYRVHRSTVARWLADARTSLLDQTRNEVSEKFGVPRLEVDSLMRVVSSRFDLSAGIFLSDSADGLHP